MSDSTPDYSIDAFTQSWKEAISLLPQWQRGCFGDGEAPLDEVQHKNDLRPNLERINEVLVHASTSERLYILALVSFFCPDIARTRAEDHGFKMQPSPGELVRILDSERTEILIKLTQQFRGW